MKKVLLSIFIVVSCFALVGCAKKTEESNEGKIVMLTVYSNPSAGYNWTHKLSKEGIVKVTTDYKQGSCPKEWDNCGGEQTYTLTALKPGKVTLKLTYIFTNDPKKYTKTAVYKIRVDKKLEIHETHYGDYFEGKED